MPCYFHCLFKWNKYNAFVFWYSNCLVSQVKVPLYGCDCYAYALLASGFVDLVIESGLKVSYILCYLITFPSGCTTSLWIFTMVINLKSHFPANNWKPLTYNLCFFRYSVYVRNGWLDGSTLKCILLTYSFIHQLKRPAHQLLIPNS